MSEENLRSFLEAAVEDESLKAKLKAIAARHGDNEFDETQTEEIWKNEILPLAKAEGFDVSLEDVRALQATASPGATKLAEEELNTVVGGLPFSCYCFAGGGGTTPDAGDKVCACVMYGIGKDADGSIRCSCWVGGHGYD